jgi:hypothetical protein
MRIWRVASILFLLVFASVSGCYRSLKDYPVKDGPEKEVKNVLLTFERAYNDKDLNSLARCFDAFPILEVDIPGILPPGEMVGKEEVEEALSLAMKRFPKITLGEPTVFLTLDSGNKAVMEVVSRFEDSAYPIKFSMMRDTGGWVIKKMVIY